MRVTTFFLCLIISLKLSAQGVGVGQWRDHLPFQNPIAITHSGGVIYAATSSDLFSYDLIDYSIETYSKANILSDIGITSIKFNDYNQMLVVVYENANVDVITSDNEVINLPDIKLKNMIGKKTINDIFFIDDLAYLSCGFGIIVLDLDRMEIKDTYFIGKNGAQVNVNDITSDGDNLFAATDVGVFEASLNSSNLADYSFWKVHDSIPKVVYSEIEYFQGHIIANLFSPLYNQDTIYKYDGSDWSKFYSKTYTLVGLYATEDILVTVRKTDVSTYNIKGSRKQTISKFDDKNIKLNGAVRTGQGEYWMATQTKGLIGFSSDLDEIQILPNGPPNPNAFKLTKGLDNDIWVAPGQLDGSINNTWTKADVYHFKDETWSSMKAITTDLDPYLDLVSITVDPSNSEKIYASTYFNGLIEIEKNKVNAVYWDSTSSISNQQIAPDTKSVQVGGSAFDTEGNLWISNSRVSKNLCVRKADGTWDSFSFGTLVSTKNETMDIIVTQYGQKWILVPKNGGILVYDDNYTIDDHGDDMYTKLTTAAGKGNLPSNDVLCLTEDADGEVWVGTKSGITVFYSPELIFENEDYDSEQILIERDGYAEYLLESEAVSAIAVDGANRKWIGTQSSGVYLMSASGTTQLKHFETENSPLLSNTIMDIAISDNGEVFIATDKGIISYRSDSSTTEENFSNVCAFPNPVEPSYQGPISITGFVEDTEFKITDISGHLIYQANAKGGMGIWDGTTYTGQRVSTGVYLVFATKSDGTQSAVTKILVVN